MINAGELTHKIAIYVKSISQDSELNLVEAWTEWRTIWASPIPKTGKEYYKLNTVNSEITEAFRVRYIGGITPHQRIKFRCKYFEIIEVINEGEKNQSLMITCKAVV
jgi:SPP1 family predicted phage head-tail adaptor